MFSPSFYEQLEDRLTLAVHDINEEHRMFRSVRWSGSGPNSSRSQTTRQPLERQPKSVTSPEAIAKVDSAVSAITATEPKEQPRMSTIGEVLKAAKAEIAQVRQGAADAAAETHQLVSVAMGKVDEIKKENSDLQAELAELTNGGPL